MAAPTLDPRRERHWRGNRRLTAALLALWFLVTFGLVFFARELRFTFFGWPFGVWVTAQGAIIVYGLIIWVYQLRMNRLDRACELADGDD
ncbi:MAG: DUF4212 domain-containing protein [Burkholderiaceae bacterium]